MSKNNTSGSSSKETRFPVEAISRRTKTDPILFGALKSAYGWTERTWMTRAEFLEKRDAWLKRPAKEG